MKALTMKSLASGVLSFPSIRRLSRCGIPGRRAALAAALVLGAGAAPALAEPSFSLMPSASSVLAGQAFTLNIRANEMTDLFAYQFDLNFNPALFRVTGVAAGPFLSAAGTGFFSPGTINNTAGSVSFIFETLVGPVSGVSGSGLLGIVSFSALANVAGTGSIGLSEATALNSASNAIALGATAPASVSVVPEPSAGWLLALGLVGIALRRPAALSSR